MAMPTQRLLMLLASAVSVVRHWSCTPGIRRMHALQLVHPGRSMARRPANHKRREWPRDSTGQTLAAVIRSRAKAVGLPDALSTAVVTAIEAKRTAEDVKAAVIAMHQDIANFYLPGSYKQAGRHAHGVINFMPGSEFCASASGPSATSKVVTKADALRTVWPSGNSSRQSSTASRRFATASSTVSPCETVPVSGLRAL